MSRRAARDDDSSYRRGMVLGLTMAEVMLLLVFCLLIAVAALLTASRKEMTEAEIRIEDLLRRAETAEAALAEVRSIDRLVADRAPEAAGRLDDFWRRLVLNTGVVERLEAAGVDVEALSRRADFIAAVAPLAETRTGREVVEAVAVAEALEERLGPQASDPEAVAALADRAADAERLQDRVESLDEALVAARAGKRVDLPPILTLAEDRGFFFETGRAVLSESAAARLHDETVPSLADLIARYDVDVIEVIGHTDERPVTTNAVSNLDRSLLDVVRGGPVAALTPADNAGLGLARAVAVAQVLKSDRRLAGYQILPLSAAQLIDTDGRLTAGTYIGDVRERRRIEIRLRRSRADEAGSARPESGPDGAALVR